MVAFFRVENDTELFLLGLGLDASLSPSLVLGKCIDIARKSPVKRTAVFKEIYPDIRKELKLSSVNAVDLQVRRAIDALWKSRPDFIQEVLFCGQLNRKPTPAQFISAFAVYLGEPED